MTRMKRNHYAEWKKSKKDTVCLVPFIQNALKFKPIYKVWAGQWLPGDDMGGAFRVGITKEQKETFVGDGYVFYLDFGDGLTAVSKLQNASNCTF